MAIGNPVNSSSRCLLHIAILLYLLSIVESTIQHVNCAKQLSSCKCELEDGGIIDLTALAKTDGTAKFKSSYQGEDFNWNPCFDFTIPGASACTGVAVCKTSFYRGTYYSNLGEQKSAKFLNSSTYGLQLSYTYTQPYATTNSLIGLQCDKNSDANTFTVEGQKPPYKTVNFYMTLSSKHCCPVYASPNVSIGTILLITFIVVLFAYMVSGCFYMGCYRGARFPETIPNLDFWKQLPRNVMDGFVFTLHGFRSKGREYQML